MDSNEQQSYPADSLPIFFLASFVLFIFGFICTSFVFFVRRIHENRDVDEQIYYRISYLILAACTFLYIPIVLINKSRGKPTDALETCIMYHTILMFMFKSCHIWCAWYIPIKGKPISIQMVLRLSVYNNGHIRYRTLLPNVISFMLQKSE
ncbi:hypothetical protein CAEBREN_11256 [Caenorhabditis brenneri]|uniref:Uncharacterized protein n=1 Tax=Caenorhabditis brenneri TaxID=135651 RepID=G0PL59_CAEBE|nr:hypothetical protein CAEBREN_11256 [Caenorhabditis brenneri]